MLICIASTAVDKQSDGRSRIYISSDGMATGEHNFDLTWSGLPVSQSPGSAIVSSQQAADKVVLTGRGLAAAQTGEQAHFTIGMFNTFFGIFKKS